MTQFVCKGSFGLVEYKTKLSAQRHIASLPCTALGIGNKHVIGIVCYLFCGFIGIDKRLLRRTVISKVAKYVFGFQYTIGQIRSNVKRRCPSDIQGYSYLAVNCFNFLYIYSKVLGSRDKGYLSCFRGEVYQVEHPCDLVFLALFDSSLYLFYCKAMETFEGKQKVVRTFYSFGFDKCAFISFEDKAISTDIPIGDMYFG